MEGNIVKTYNARVVYTLENGATETIESSDFVSVDSATEWLSSKLTWFMMNWWKINHNGLAIAAEVYKLKENFSDVYELKCGL